MPSGKCARSRGTLSLMPSASSMRNPRARYSATSPATSEENAVTASCGTRGLSTTPATTSRTDGSTAKISPISRSRLSRISGKV